MTQHHRLDIDFLDQDFLVDILAQLNKQLALQIRSEFDKVKIKKRQVKMSLVLYY